MADSSLSETVARLFSDKQRERTEALTDLRRILNRKRQDLSETLNDKAYHRIFEAVFRCVAIEKSVYSRSSKSSNRSATTPRLPLCASAFRATLEVSVAVLRTKTVHAIIDHIVQTLTQPGDGLWDLLAIDYIKGLRLLLEYPAHVEHLTESDWVDAITFCLSCLKSNENEGTQLSVRSSHVSLTDAATDTEGGRRTPSRAISTRNVVSSSSQVNRSISDEAVVCIQLLTATPTAPLQDVVRQLMSELLIYLSSSTSANGSQALKAINNLLDRVICDQCALVKELLPDIIPVIRRLWMTKLPAVKDEVLVTMMLCMDLLRSNSRALFAQDSLQPLEDLVETLELEYTKRPEKDYLQIDDLVFYQNDANLKQVYLFGPRLGNPRSEQNWTLIWTISSLIGILDKTLNHMSNSAEDELAPNKRPRLSSRTDDVLRDCLASTGPRKGYCLQLLSFLGRRMSVEDKVSLLSRLAVSIVDDNPFTSNWTLLVISNIAISDSAKSPLLKTYWRQIWDLTFRACAFQVNTRAACALMETILRLELVDSADLIDNVRSMLSGMDLNGPSALCDTSLRFLTTMFEKRVHTAAGLSMDSVKGVCNWLRSAWTFGAGVDKLQMAQVALFALPANFLGLLLSITNRPASLSHADYQGTIATISSAWFRHREQSALKEYLFLFDDQAISHDLWCVDETFLLLVNSVRSDPNDHVVIELLQTKVDTFSQAWKIMSEEKSQHITADLFKIMVSACIVVALFIECLPQPDTNRVADLRRSSLSLWTDICDYITLREDLLQACLSLLSPIVASAPYIPNRAIPISRALFDLTFPLVANLKTSQSTQNDMDDPDTMDFDGIASPLSDELARDVILYNNRHNVKAFPEPNTFQRCISTRLSIFLSSNEQSGTGPSSGASLVGSLKALDDVDVLSTRNFLPRLFRDCDRFSRTDILELVEHFGEICLQRYQLERCESAQCFSISMMECFVDSWTRNENDDLCDSAADLYGWFIQVLLNKKKGSSGVLISLSRLLEKIISLNPSFSVDGTGASPRTSLFTILRDGDTVVKFAIASCISNIFGRFLLKDHERIFDDVVESLPTDPDWNEGIALRLYILGQLASRWPTLLRRSIYHIFETPAQVPESTRYAEKCLTEVSRSLRLQEPKDIFRLFMPQILYTWTETQSIVSMPFSIFRYSSLKEMLQDAQDELVGQIMMRANDQDAKELATHLEKPFSVLLQGSFYKAEAYTVARDISLPPSQDSQPKGVESRVKKTLGTDQFAQSIETKFPEVVSALFRSLSQEDQIERAFAKWPSFDYASEILKRITEKSASTTVLPGNQQPSFRARYLLDELEYLCKRAGYDLETMWTPALVSFVCRTLLDSMHPALGSLHACSVLRKIRILVCISGSIITQDYPLEQLLYALRPYLTDFYCSEDALGLFWYLLEEGKPYLTHQPGFLAGIAVSTLVSIRNFLQSTPESTTQESQFNAVISKSQEFRQWFGKFLEEYRASNLDQCAEDSFRRMVTSSKQISNTGNSAKGTYESELLLELLQDRTSRKSLLSRSVSDLVLSLLCVDFRISSDIFNDILGEDDDSSKHNVAVWQSIQSGVTDKGYRLWAARVLGRAFAATGQVNEELLREQNMEMIPSQSQALRHTEPLLVSKAAVLQVLCEALLNSDRANVGIVERTLQLVMSKVSRIPGLEQCESIVPPPLMKALIWEPYICPEIQARIPESKNDNLWPALDPESPISSTQWARDLTLALVTSAEDDAVIGPLRDVIYVIPDLSVRLLQFVLHDVLILELEKNQVCRETVSKIFNDVLHSTTEATISHSQIVLNAVLYLRQQQRPQESTIVERDEWLDIDYGSAASAAVTCRMYRTALLFIEIQTSKSISTTRRSSVKYVPPTDLLHDIYRRIGDPDLFYGIQQDATLNSVLEKLDYESAGFKNLIFQSARYDSDLRLDGKGNTHGLFKALNATNLHGVANAMLATPNNTEGTTIDSDHLLSTAISLRQWDIPALPSQGSAMPVLFKAFQNMNTVDTIKDVLRFNDTCFLNILDQTQDKNRSVTTLRDSMRVLGLLTEVDDVLRSTTPEQVENLWNRITSRTSWFQVENFQDIAHILFCRGTLFSSINRKPYLKSALKLTSRTSQLLEVKALRESFKISKELEGSQEALTSAISLSKLVQPCTALGLSIENAAKYDMANVLWDQGEMTTSIRMLQQLNEQCDLQKQALVVSRAEVLASLGHHVAEARLEKPDAIIEEYLVPAVKELRGNAEGEEAGSVFHRFASFCDQQLLNQDSLEDFQRIEQLRDRKEQEVLALKQMMSAADGKEKNQLKVHYTKAKGWFDLDDREYQRLSNSREAFLQQCLENYLLSLKACDSYKNDALRFCALWLDKSGDPNANESVAKYLSEVPSRKFAPLINQLSSRLLDESDSFQTLLSALVFRICVDHPFHGMYQIFAHSKTRGNRDQAALSRFRAATNVVDKLLNDKHACPTWMSLHNNNICYVRFATEKLDDKIKSGAKVPLKKSPMGLKLEQDVNNQKLPPPSMWIELRVDCNYSNVPKVVKFHPEFAVASGISAPKIVTVVASDGLRYKQLVKGGNDDLRQDAIMEQVFEQVSNVLRDHRSTRQRNLHIRTYKVLPLTANAGIIEFVQNTIPLHDYLMPAHQKYFPKDMKPSACRKHISDVQTRTLEQRVRTYRQVIEHFHPVMRFFFMEKFNNPDDWFSKRLAYTRSTAAISILGHVLGLGDRHGHNILLDEKTGEVVHIDLGVAFEQGRVLPVPEVVPFRLTRDLVDGMGITKTEGVFRRCCEFTLEALRRESYSIMTILDVLRYDPLYMWTVSPLRMRRMQDAQDAGGEEPPSSVLTKGVERTKSKNKDPKEPSEADRALTVVAKKLSKTLSVTATVNELIQQATDERNLAVLYCGTYSLNFLIALKRFSVANSCSIGWAAYA
ncbi:phosphotidylinositol kinase Tel1, putative [Talaromyces stipitatus ATCC 10500]|uniref:Serine/threonine-protein kinase Tel1 n=1 Tax=Talaromyces stipitatus (strain ATCC 10500 / CBS 375.48 / QM 6759 / NRRL 1006) TaxID=441959 RepID=B8LSU9_TALSN|nr:phosphotidylinositol kinase Tel1, putative [Talaromyces stipitatus ATCC 10500]EED22945.1 phosphotidylinositol kinase Tel1, putative [Talaromyces stipitatus ATCC 10500]